MVGDLIALMSGVTFSFYFVFMRMQKEGSPLASNLLSQWIAAGVCLAVSLFLPPPRFTQESVIEPLLNPLWVFLVLGEHPGMNTIIGGAVILGAVTWVSTISARRGAR